mmetsp:Transcript_26320/g.36691  ORF Transcript_26320/g.36691 Transcript_26320/m.36691 type:complete len:349 (-) Transcript_26320:226-1272(-)|eukprot:CAMPEP_0184486886 /NCGR_PEP_ID=MMETSP0113_2-20130426/8773_1 /TAXON_ID=91329 /ORGANISM="Norrisiella sphaerica, Strain BC52" /LENGTH=348 /DNA_ID=CAMNT_0026868961 /DNA_START=152 /DNA_END=1198 /DNA_ORIENTATION=-
MEYATFNAQRSGFRKINCKRTLFYLSLFANVALLLFIGYHASPKSYDARPTLGLSAEYAQADENEDGEVTPEEIHSMIEDVMHQERAHRPSQMVMAIHGMLPDAIRAGDKNGDGAVNMAEAQQMMGGLPAMMAGMMAPQGQHRHMADPADHAEYMELQNRVQNEFKDAVLDLALKNRRNESISQEECFGNCFNRCRWMLEAQTCLETCNQGCGTEAELFDPAAIVKKMASERDLQYGENKANYTMTLKMPGIQAEGLAVEVRGPVLVVRGQALQQHKHYNVTHQFLHSVGIPRDVKKNDITSELESETLTVTLPKDPVLTAELEAERKRIAEAAAGKDESRMIAAPSS